jgi:hypothetical protein
VQLCTIADDIGPETNGASEIFNRLRKPGYLERQFKLGELGIMDRDFETRLKLLTKTLH